jgi:hypothetical protein
MPLECTKQAVGLSFPFGLLVLGDNGAMNVANLGNIAVTAFLKAGLGPLYPFGHANFKDRHKGAHFFGQSIPGIISLHCTKHIIENARHYVCQAQKSFHDNMVWVLQGSRSQGEHYVHLTKFNANYPDVKVQRTCL